MDSTHHTSVLFCPECGKQNTADASFCNGCGNRLPTEALEPSDPLLGRSIDGRFKIVRLLGEGGMGQVYLAEQISMGRPVALKVLSPMFGTEERVKDRFRNEAALASRLNHPSTVTIYDFGVTEDGLMFIAMELIQGRSLREVLDEYGAMAWPRVAAIVRQICGSLQDAHDKTIIHRDLKPENIMLVHRNDEQDFVKVLDFGLAKILDDNDWQGKRGLTAPNEVFGTPEYMSPEQARGDEMSPHTDIYSLGIIIYRMLTGLLPFDGNTPIAILAQHLADTPPRIQPQSLTPAVPDTLCRLVDSCLSKLPHDRPESMGSIARVLEQLLYAEHEAPAERPIGSLAVVSESSDEAVTMSSRSVPETALHTGVVEPQEARPQVHGAESGEAPLPSSGDTSLGRSAEQEEVRSQKELTLERLLEQIQKQKDFPAISEHISELNTKVGQESTSASQLSNVILKDTSLTTRLIKLANSAYYGNAKGGVTMVSRAVVLMGFEAVREAALGLLLFDNLQTSDPTLAAELRDTAIGSLMSAIVAKEQAKRVDGVNKEEAFICAMFHDLGKHAATFYFPKEMADVRERVEGGLTEERAVLEVFGVSMDELGRALARHWDFPEQIRSTMFGLPAGPIARPRSKTDRLRHIAGFSTALVKASAITDKNKRAYALKELAHRFSASVKINADEIGELLDDALEKLEGYARNMNLRPGDSKFLRNILAGAGRTPSIQVEDVVAVKPHKTRSGRILRASDMTDEDYQAVVEQIAAEELAEKEKMFEEGVAEVAASIKGRFDLNGVMLMVLETMYRGLGLNRVIFCLNDVRTRTLRGRFGFGENVDELIPDFHFSARGRLDVFGHAISTGEDAVIVNIPDKPLPLKVPLWYKNLVNAPLILLYPIRVKQFPAALFYGDLKTAEIELNPSLMEQMRLLRDEATRAMEMANKPKGRAKRSRR